MKTPLTSRNFLRAGIFILLIVILLGWIHITASGTFPHLQKTEGGVVSAGSITLSGMVLSNEGRPLPGASVIIQNRAVITTENGTFSVPGLQRNNSILSIEAPGFREEFIPLQLVLPLNRSRVVVDPVLLTASDPGEVRFLFGGDTHFGRRYIDPLETTPRGRMPPDDPAALVLVSDPAPGSRRVLEYVRPLFQEADFSSVNLESPVVRNVSTPHREKEYVLFTLPESLEALKWLGVGYVSTGNNHVYDYLEPGMNETRDHIEAAGIATSGSGLNEDQAFEAYHLTIRDSPYAFMAMNSIDGSEYEVSYVANSTQGGSANAKDTPRVRSSIQREKAAGYIPVVQLHGGDEYSFKPSPYVESRMDMITASGAGLVVSHHPHTAQGVGLMNDVLVIEGLGNFAFDAERHETMLGLLARVDMQGSTVRSVRLIPVFIENFTPRQVSGRLADTFIRRLNEASGGTPLRIYPYNGQGRVSLDTNSTLTRVRTVEITMSIHNPGGEVIDLRQYASPGESLAAVRDDAPGTTARMGRDLMLGGDFEDGDIDNRTGETDFWALPEESTSLSFSDPYRGAAALRSVREANNTDDSIIPFRTRIRVMGDSLNQVPNKNVTFLGYLKGENAGPVTIVARYCASEGEMTFGDEKILSILGGTFPWQPSTADIHIPPDDPTQPRNPATDPRAVQIFIRHSPPESGVGVAAFDELAVISWEETLDLSQGAWLNTPHARDFLLVSGSPGPHRIVLEFRSYKPSAAYFT